MPLYSLCPLIVPFRDTRSLAEISSELLPLPGFPCEDCSIRSSELVQNRCIQIECPNQSKRRTLGSWSSNAVTLRPNSHTDFSSALRVSSLDGLCVPSHGYTPATAEQNQTKNPGSSQNSLWANSLQVGIVPKLISQRGNPSQSLLNTLLVPRWSTSKPSSMTLSSYPVCWNICSRTMS